MSPILLYILFSVPFFSSAAKTPITVGTLTAAKDSAVVAQYQSFIISVLEETEFQVNPKPLPIRRSFDGLIKGDLDAVIYDDLTVKDGREHLVTVSFPIAFTSIRLFYRADLIPFDSENLEKYRGAFNDHNPLITGVFKGKKMKHTSTTTAVQSMQMLLSGRADYFIDIEELGLGAIESSLDAQNKINMHLKPIAMVPIYFTLNKRHSKSLPAIEANFKKHLKTDIAKYPLIQHGLNKKLEKVR